MLKQLCPEYPGFAAAIPHAASPHLSPLPWGLRQPQVLTGVGLGHWGGRGGGGGGGGLCAGGGGWRRCRCRAAGGGGGSPHGLCLRRQHGRQLWLLDDLDPVRLRPRWLPCPSVVEIDLWQRAALSQHSSERRTAPSCRASQPTACLCDQASQQHHPQHPSHLPIWSFVLYPDLLSWGHCWCSRRRDRRHSWREHHTRRWWHATHGRRHKWWSLKAYNNNNDDNDNNNIITSSFPFLENQQTLH